MGVGATATRFVGRNRDQFKRFSAIPNLLYTDGNEWALYRGGNLVGRVVRLSGDVAAEGKKAAVSRDAHALESLLRDDVTDALKRTDSPLVQLTQDWRHSTICCRGRCKS